jgi:hypothetical protein
VQRNTFFITSSYVFTVPSDWSDQNTIELTGGGGGGGSRGFFISDSGGGSFFDYQLGGAGGGYASVTNLKTLKPGDQITVVIGRGGGAGTNFGGAGGTTSFGGLILATGGTVGPEKLPNKPGGYGIINLGAGSYDTARLLAGQSKFYQTSGNFGPIPSGRIGGSAPPPARGGRGGNGGLRQSTGFPEIFPQSGQAGSAYITYVPSGTHQACVWIS